MDTWKLVMLFMLPRGTCSSSPLPEWRIELHTILNFNYNCNCTDIPVSHELEELEALAHYFKLLDTLKLVKF
jgi:hypothetical protein